jgi:hypothetical protein
MARVCSSPASCCLMMPDWTIFTSHLLSVSPTVICLLSLLNYYSLILLGLFAALLETSVLKLFLFRVFLFLAVHLNPLWILISTLLSFPPS